MVKFELTPEQRQKLEAQRAIMSKAFAKAERREVQTELRNQVTAFRRTQDPSIYKEFAAAYTAREIKKVAQSAQRGDVNLADPAWQKAITGRLKWREGLIRDYMDTRKTDLIPSRRKINDIIDRTNRSKDDRAPWDEIEAGYGEGKKKRNKKPVTDAELNRWHEKKMKVASSRRAATKLVRYG